MNGRMRRAVAFALVALAAVAVSAASAAEIEMLDGSVIRGKVVEETDTDPQIMISVSGQGSAGLSIPKDGVHVVRDGGRTRVVNEKAPASPPVAALKSDTTGKPGNAASTAPAISLFGKPADAKRSAGDDGQTVFGYRGDRNGDYPGCTPPIVWDEATKKNLAWKTVLPNWCYGQPIVVGQKIFVMSEPGWKSDYPELLCLDLNTGKILWQKQIDHLEQAVPNPKRREQIRAGWASLLDRMRICFRLVDESWAAGDDQTEVKKKVAKVLGEKKTEELWYWKPGKTGRKFGLQSNAGGYGVLRSWGIPENGKGDRFPGLDSKLKELGLSVHGLAKEAGLRLETFYGFGKDREGEAFPTPASDGKSVYVVTDQGAHACFDLDGHLRWLTWIKPAFNGGGHDDSICRSPILCDGLMITDLHASDMPVIALDMENGREVWRASAKTPGSCGSSKVLDVGGKRYLVQNSGHVLRVADGKAMLDLAKQAGTDFHCGQAEPAVDDRSDMAFFIPGKGQSSSKEVVGFSLSVAGEGLAAEEAWRLPLKAISNTMAVHQDRLYTGCDAVEIATGTLVPSWSGDRSPTRWLLAIAGGRFYTMGENGTCKVFNLDGKRVSTNKMLTTTEDPDLQARHAAIWGNRQQWNGISYSAAFTFAGNRILIRTWDYLVCFATMGPPHQ